MGFGVWYFGICGLGGLGILGLTLHSPHLGVEVLNVGGWLTHGDLALDAGVDFLAVVEHRLIPARIRSESSQLRNKGLSSIWAPASQSHLTLVMLE